MSVAPAEVEREETGLDAVPDTPWVTIVWNDPINLMSYVTYVFQKVFGYAKPKAEKLMLDVHHRGRAVVSNEELAAAIGAAGPTSPPEDPVLARLLPDAYRDDPEAAGEFRRYTEQGLRSGKVAAAQTVLDTLPAGGGHVRLGPEDAQAWLRALNDVRLAIGTVLGITEDYEDEMEAASWADPRSAYLEVYHWLGYVQDSLVRALW